MDDMTFALLERINALSERVAALEKQERVIDASTITANTLVRRDSSSIIAANGLIFPVTQSASANANTLDDYEEGTWTPTLASDGSQPTVTYTAQDGTYTKIGRLVVASFTIALTATSGGSGSIGVGGWPFAIQQTGGATPAHVYGFTFSAGYTSAVLYTISAGGTFCYLIAYGSGGLDNVGIGIGSGNRGIRGTLSYITS